MFLLVPAHAGCPRQNPESRKMVVCVCYSEKFVPLPLEQVSYFHGHEVSQDMYTKQVR